ncbi:MAG: hypothetical protein KGJ13_09855, partial [Patescibacteria group bacterium]|nr:hypothetical protein [Patescibacteria group bacterium]
SMRETETTAPGLIIINGPDCLEEYKSVIELRPSNWEWISLETNVGWVRALNAAIAIRPQKEWYAVINDDHVPITKNWDALMLKLIGPWNLVTCLDNSREVQWRASGPLIAGGELLRTCGFFMPPCNWHICGDDWWQLVGRAFSLWRVAANVRVDQPDSAIFAMDNAADAKPDETHESSYGDFWTQVGLYHRWLAEQGGDIMEKLRVVLQANGELKERQEGRFVIVK